MLDLFLCFVTCISLLVSNANTLRCQAIANSLRAVDGAVLLVAGVFKAGKTPVPTKAWPLWVPPTQTVLMQPATNLWLVTSLCCLVVLLALTAALAKTGGLRTRSKAAPKQTAKECLPSSSCVHHPELVWYDVESMRKTAVPGPNALVDAPSFFTRCPEFLGSRSWKPVATFSVKNPVDPSQLRFKRALGSGTFGEVLQVWSVQRQELLAVKRISKRKINPPVNSATDSSRATDSSGHDSADSSARTITDSKHIWCSFAWELLAHQRMALNPAFPALHGAFHDRDNYYLVMDCGRTCLVDVLIQSRNIALWYGRQLARALQALHERGVMHSDLKEENLLLGADGRLIVIDFGLAHVFQMPESPAERFPRWNALAQQSRREPGAGHFPLLWPGDDNPHTAPVRGGTPGFMSPEAQGGEECSYGADLFAFGTLLGGWLGHSSNHWQTSNLPTTIEHSFLTRLLSSTQPLRFESWREILEHPIWDT
ncbi:kinase-like domain-containing protein [Mycena haematopus]|nr:kinase-like domain-containing protein [Mycena haematopus]